MREKILNVLILGEIDAITHGRDLETKEVTKSCRQNLTRIGRPKCQKKPTVKESI